MYKVHVIENGIQATEKINMMQSEGFTKEDVYLFAHDKNRSENLTDATRNNRCGCFESKVYSNQWVTFSKAAVTNYALNLNL